MAKFKSKVDNGSHCFTPLVIGILAPADGTKYLGVKVNNWTGVPKKTQAKNLNSGRQSPPQIQAKVGNAKPVCNREDLYFEVFGFSSDFFWKIRSYCKGMYIFI
jgi:hypothetical protein